MTVLYIRRNVLRIRPNVTMMLAVWTDVIAPVVMILSHTPAAGYIFAFLMMPASVVIPGVMLVFDPKEGE